MNVYTKIAAVMAEMSKTGLEKSRRNQSQGYNFRGIDDVYNAMAPIMSRVGLVVIPKVLSREVVERVNNKGTALFYVTVMVEYTFFDSESGTSVTSVMAGEAMDSGDKATNKAMSAALKYACLQVFMIPTQGDNDADAHTHEVMASRPQPKAVELDPEQVDMYTAQLQASDDLTVMAQVWADIPKEYRTVLGVIKDAHKAKLQVSGNAAG